MGSWFSNFHIRNNGALGQDDIKAALVQILAEKGFRLTEDPEGADGQILCIAPEGSAWFSVCGDCLAHDDPTSCAAIASPLSALLHTDVMGIACFDSDYLYLNLINSDEKLDGWIGIGSGKDIGLSRRSSISAWKTKAADYAELSAKAKQKYPVAEMFLSDAADNLGMDFSQSTFFSEVTEDVLQFTWYYTEKFPTSGKAELAHYPMYFPCKIGQESTVCAVNLGAAVRGLSIYFIGPYVEHGEITFADVQIRCQEISKEITLSREQTASGRWAYVWHDPDFQIPSSPPRRMHAEKRRKMEYERRIRVAFTPQGDPRKTLDITVVFMPDENPQGGTQCNVWSKYGSKQAFIEHYNKTVKRVRAIEGCADDSMPYLKEEDFD